MGDFLSSLTAVLSNVEAAYAVTTPAQVEKLKTILAELEQEEMGDGTQGT